jgi:tricorn protease-like protein
MLIVGTKEGKTLLYRFKDNADLIFTTKSGISFGAITSVAISQEKGETIITANETGEIMQYDLKSKLNQPEMQ